MEIGGCRKTSSKEIRMGMEQEGNDKSTDSGHI